MLDNLLLLRKSNFFSSFSRNGCWYEYTLDVVYLFEFFLCMSALPSHSFPFINFSLFINPYHLCSAVIMLAFCKLPTVIIVLTFVRICLFILSFFNSFVWLWESATVCAQREWKKKFINLTMFWQTLLILK